MSRIGNGFSGAFRGGGWRGASHGYEVWFRVESLVLLAQEWYT